MTQEDWHGVLYNGMKNTSPWAALYFIALMTFGNYVLFNLLVAILVEGFSSEVKRRQLYYYGYFSLIKFYRKLRMLLNLKHNQIIYQKLIHLQFVKIHKFLKIS